MKIEKCCVSGCDNAADVEVILYDVYLNKSSRNRVFFERDFTCPFLCYDHVVENEEEMIGQRKPRGDASYPFTNKHNAVGFTIYRPLQSP